MRTGIQLATWVLVPLLMVTLPQRAAGQLIRVPEKESVGPRVTVSGGAGLLLVGDRYDAVEGSRWLMGEAIQMRGVVDIAMRSALVSAVFALRTQKSK